MIRLAFHGAAGTVTGSRFVLEVGAGRVSGRDSGAELSSDAKTRRVLIDCGLFQGRKELRERNWGDPGFDVREVDSVLLTHAHIDHSGYLPRLVRDGFSGPIHCTSATADLVEILLEDSARIQEEDAEYANKRGFSRHHPALPLYTVQDAQRVVPMLVCQSYGHWFNVCPGVRARYRPAGHIIGSGSIQVEVEREGRAPLRLLFSGDVGRYDAPLVPDPASPEPADVLVVESTYGDRTHPTEPVEAQLESILARIVETQGVALFASFAVGRAQQLAYLLHKLQAEKRWNVPVHIDSPMAIDATKIYRRYPEEHGIESVRFMSGATSVFGSNVYLHRTREDSMRLNDLQGARVIIASSGMMTGGRILHHLRRHATDPRAVIVLGGYQAPGTRGASLQSGSPTVRIHGRDVEVHAEVRQLSGLSAHADRDELLRWLQPLAPPKRTFIVHGEPPSAAAFAEALDSRGHRCTVPGMGDAFDLSEL
ncbi:MAG: MBL fold metallo-hydrolase [Planctomycetota bacterium]